MCGNEGHLTVYRPGYGPSDRLTLTYRLNGSGDNVTCALAPGHEGPHETGDWRAKGYKFTWSHDAGFGSGTKAVI